MSDEVQILQTAVRAGLKGADDGTVRLVTAISGLLAAVAYADRTITPEESAQLRAELGRIHGLDPRSVEVIAEILHAHALRFSTAFAPRFSRTLREEGGRELCLEVLGMLVELSAVDGKISLSEVTSLRNLATSLGLSQVDYNDFQEKHRDKLSFL